MGASIATCDGDRNDGEKEDLLLNPEDKFVEVEKKPLWDINEWKAPIRYRIQEGETMPDIAVRFDKPLDDIMKLNPRLQYDVDPETNERLGLTVNQEIIIPKE